jgi:hypothetical protein
MSGDRKSGGTIVSASEDQAMRAYAARTMVGPLDTPNIHQNSTRERKHVGDLIGRLTHEGCGGKPKHVELITGIPGSQH